MSDVLDRISSQFDSYSRKARLAPGLLLLLGPVAVGIGVGVPEWPGASALAAAVAAMGLPFTLAGWVRRRGQLLQQRLWRNWGGNPVVVSLRGDGIVARRRRSKLAAATGLPIDDPTHPDFEEAAANAVRRLISATRDNSRYPLVFAENKAYGFARNLLAVQDTGKIISAVALTAGAGSVGLSLTIEQISTVGTMLGTLVAAAVLTTWIFYPTEERVRAAAHDYRERLLEALDAGALTSENVTSD